MDLSSRYRVIRKPMRKNQRKRTRNIGISLKEKNDYMSMIKRQSFKTVLDKSTKAK